MTIGLLCKEGVGGGKRRGVGGGHIVPLCVCVCVCVHCTFNVSMLAGPRN